MYVGPFAHIATCEFDGPNVHIQDHNIRKATSFGDYNIGAHGIRTRNVKMAEGSATLFHCMPENVNMDRGSIAEPLTTPQGRSSYDRLEIPDNHVVCGFANHEHFSELLQRGEMYEGAKLRAVLMHRSEFDLKGLGDRLFSIDNENATVHANKKRNIIAVPVATYFNRHNIRTFADEIIPTQKTEKQGKTRQHSFAQADREPACANGIGIISSPSF